MLGRVRAGGAHFHATPSAQQWATPSLPCGKVVRCGRTSLAPGAFPTKCTWRAQSVHNVGPSKPRKKRGRKNVTEGGQIGLPQGVFDWGLDNQILPWRRRSGELSALAVFAHFVARFPRRYIHCSIVWAKIRDSKWCGPGLLPITTRGGWAFSLGRIAARLHGGRGPCGERHRMNSGASHEQSIPGVRLGIRSD